ncbi:PH domain-containing protein [Streptomyces rectiverticillatus]|uniref:PH domain-containing protein n=1 Tax=Streptomyces rectiverticillatus TaxID=173860 RepID=UPI0015C2F477|nr:PH domain-containing protein [Streptomyces rectiverticillatus]
MDVNVYRIAVSKAQWVGMALMTLCGVLCLLRVTFGIGWGHYLGHWDGSVRQGSVANYPSPDLMLAFGILLLSLTPFSALAFIWRTWTTPAGVRTRGIFRRRFIPWQDIASVEVTKHGGYSRYPYYHLQVQLHSGRRLCLPGLQDRFEDALTAPRTEIVSRWKAAHVSTDRQEAQEAS